jgi:hypothetical protein
MPGTYTVRRDSVLDLATQRHPALDELQKLGFIQVLLALSSRGPHQLSIPLPNLARHCVGRVPGGRGRVVTLGYVLVHIIHSRRPEIISIFSKYGVQLVMGRVVADNNSPLLGDNR